ncbi:UNVERIFIED_CONTAM: hypothetical protein Slati_1442800 [Sesamum latifolium]|uniref:Uncharacterized protein n=1 Tax=Sesamum latifolium TaxID=2727402 RepID=A0AAW2X423_9LAMI
MLRELRRLMYHKNLLGRAGFTPEFKDGVKTFIEWAKCQRDMWMETKLGALVGSEKTQSLEHPTILVITCECVGFIPEYYNWTSHGKERVQEYFDAVTAPPVPEEQTPAAHEEGNYSHWVMKNRWIGRR